MDIMSLLVGALIQGAIGLLFYLAVKRNLEKVDRLEEKLGIMERDHISKIEADAKEHANKIEGKFTADAAKRKALYERLEDMRGEFVQVTNCTKIHEQWAAQFERFSGAVLDLARVQAETKLTAEQLKLVSERVIALGNDVSKMEGKNEHRR